MFAYLLLGELMMPVQAAGAGLIVLAMLLACLGERRKVKIP